MPIPHHKFFSGRMPSCRPTNSVKALKAWNAALSEFNIPGYNIYSNNLLVLINLSSKLLNVDFREFFLISRLLELLEPQHEMPCKQTMNSRLSSMKASMSEQLAGKLDSDACHIAITTDIWTSLSNEAYLSFMASYVDHDWTVKSPVLATVNLEDRHPYTISYC